MSLTSTMAIAGMQAMQAKIEGAKVSLTGVTRASRQVGEALTAVMGPGLSALKVSTKVSSRAGIEEIVRESMVDTLGRIEDPRSRDLWTNNITDCVQECLDMLVRDMSNCAEQVLRSQGGRRKALRAIEVGLSEIESQVDESLEVAKSTVQMSQGTARGRLAIARTEAQQSFRDLYSHLSEWKEMEGGIDNNIREVGERSVNFGTSTIDELMSRDSRFTDLKKDLVEEKARQKRDMLKKLRER